MWHRAHRVIAFYKNASLIFDTMAECCDYFSTDTCRLHVTQLRRIIDRNGVWCYQESDGTYSDVIFDELFEEGEE